MAETVNVKNIGLRGVTVADSKVSFIDGEKGILIYRGYRIEELGNSSTFPETAFLLLNGVLPDKEEMNEFNGKLLEARNIPDFLLEAMKQFPHDAHPMDVLQASIPMLATIDPDLNDETREGNIRKAIRLIARLPIVVAAWHRIRNDKSPLPPIYLCPTPAIFSGSSTVKSQAKKWQVISTPAWFFMLIIPLMPLHLHVDKSSQPRPTYIPA